MVTLIVKGTPSVARKACTDRGIHAEDFRATCPKGCHYATETHLRAKPLENQSATDFFLKIGRWFNGPEECITGQGFPDGTLLHYSHD